MKIEFKDSEAYKILIALNVYQGIVELEAPDELKKKYSEIFKNFNKAKKILEKKLDRAGRDTFPKESRSC